MKSDKIYCEFCGKVNKLGDLNCKSCGERLNQSERVLGNYLKSKVTSGKENGEVGLVDYFKYFVSICFYPVILVLLLVILVFNIVNFDREEKNVIYDLSDKVSFKSFGEEEKILGCFTGKEEVYEFLNSDRVTIYNIRDDSSETLYYKFVDKVIDGALYRRLYVSDLTNVIKEGYVFFENDDSVLVIADDMNLPERSERVSCSKVIK